MVKKGQKVQASTVTPTKAGYKFKGWFKQLSDKKAFDFSSTVTSEFTLHAKWDDVSKTDHNKPLRANLDKKDIPYVPYIPSESRWQTV